MSPVAKCKRIPVIAYINPLSASGRTTLALHTALYLAQKSDIGRRILVIDFDAQGHTSTRLMKRLDLAGLPGTRTAELFETPSDPIQPLLTPSGCELIYSLAEDIQLYDIESANSANAHLPADNLAPLLGSGRYGAVILDCPGQKTRALAAAARLANHVVVPVAASAQLNASNWLQQITSRLRRSGSNASVTGVVINKYLLTNARHQKFVAGLELDLGDLLLKQKIGLRSSFGTANANGHAVWDVRTGAHRLAAQEIQDVIREIISRVGLY